MPSGSVSCAVIVTRQFRKPRVNPSTQYWCPSCEKWSERHEVTHGDYYTLSENYVEVGGEYFYDDYISWSIWTHDECDEPISSANGSPDTRVVSDTWVCGECKREYEDEDSAQECCE